MATNNNNGVNSTQILTAAADAISNQTLNQKRRWRGFWSGFWCFGSQKQAKQINPERPVPGNGVQPVDGENPPTTLTLSIMAPPSSPASILNSSNPSATQSPAAFFSLSAMSASVYSPGGPTSNMFVTGPYANETQLVSPPAFSSLNTEPSTAPFTPPPESVHLTTPSSPEVPFAQMYTSPLDAQGASKKNGLTFPSPLISPRYIQTKDLQATYQLYPGSPLSHLISPKSAVSGSGASSPFPDLEFPARWSTHSGQDGSFPKYEPSKIFHLDKVPQRTFILSQDSEVSCFGTSERFRLDKRIYQSNIHCGSEQFNCTLVSDMCSHGEDVQQNRVAGIDTCGTSTVNESGVESSSKSEVDQLEANRASFGLSANDIVGTYESHSVVSGDIFSGSQLLAHKSYSGDSATSEKCSRKEEMQMTQLGFSDSRANNTPICFSQFIDSQARKDSEDGLISSVAPTSNAYSFDVRGGEPGISESAEHAESEHVCHDADKLQHPLTDNQKDLCNSCTKDKSPLNDSKYCAQTDVLLPSTGDFKFDKVDGNGDITMKGDLWIEHGGKRTTENGMKNWRFFPIMSPGVG